MTKHARGKHFRTLGIIIFSFLLGCMVTINLIPIEKTCKIEDTDREYNIMKNSKLKNPELIIVILSAPNNLDKRDTVRETWLKLYDKKDEDTDPKAFKIKHYFVIGSVGLTPDQLLHLSSEQSKYNDILILPMVDTYRSLTEKVKRSFVWLNDQYEYGLGFKYVLKCDDDSFVNLKALSKEIIAMENFYHKLDLKDSFKRNVEEMNYHQSMNAQVNERGVKGVNLQIYWGYFSGNARIKVVGKWQENDWIASDRYVPYALGGGYILSRKLVTYIAKNVENLRSYQSEDVSIGLWLAPINNILRVHDIRFDTEWISRGCRNSHLVTHNIPQDKMREMYKHYIEFRTICLEEINKRRYYMYDWSVLPSECCKPFDETVIVPKKQKTIT